MSIKRIVGSLFLATGVMFLSAPTDLSVLTSKYLPLKTVLREVILNDVDLNYLPLDLVGTRTAIYDYVTGEDLPVQLDPRQLINSFNKDYLTPIKNQEYDGSCWIFAQTASLEHYVKKTTGKTVIFSENNAKYALDIFSVGQEYGATKGAGSSGNFQNMISYYFREKYSGPVLEKDDSWRVSVSSEKRDDTDVKTAIDSGYHSVRNYEETGDFPRAGRVTDLRIIPFPMDELGKLIPPSEDNLFQKQIKQAITEKGGVSVNYHSEQITSSELSSGGYKNKTEYGYGCTYYTKSDDVTHAVLLVGWDDEIPAEMFASIYGEKPSKSGGWLVKNSWGTNSTQTENGYFWLSYDTPIRDTCFIDGYDANYNGEIISNAVSTSVMPAFETEEDLIFGDVFQCNSENKKLTEVSFFSAQKLKNPNNTETPFIKAEVYVSIGGVAENTVKGTADLQFGGLVTIKLDTPIELQNSEKFSVMVRLINDGNYILYVPKEREIEYIDFKGTGFYSKLQSSKNFEFGNLDFLNTNSDVFISAIIV